jgi:N-methylhydantoinase B/acetone carboxylase alpha subunit
MSATDVIIESQTDGASPVEKPRASLKGAHIGLKDRIDAFDAAIRETGHLFGLENLRLMDEDPIKFDKFQWRLFAAVNAARETSKYVSGSPAAVGMAELVDMLALPEGEVVAASAGLAGHIGSFPIMIRTMTRNGCEENPGIRDTDIWGCNDSRAGCPHPTDMYTYLPVFHEGDLVCWVAGANHVADSGHSICAGGVSMYSPTTYCDGLTYGPMVIGQRVDGEYVHYDPFLRMMASRTRTGSLNILDEKMRLTGAVMLRERVLEIIEDFGVEYFTRGMREILERERRAVAGRFQDWMLPGRYRTMMFRPIQYRELMASLYPQSAKNWITHHIHDMTITPDGRCEIDMSGTSSQDYHWQNAFEGPFKMGVTFSSIGFIGQTPLVNTALFHVIKHERPEGSIVNPTRDDVSAAFGNALGAMHGVLDARTWGFSAFLRGYLEEAYLLEHDWELFGGEGIAQEGIPWAIGDFTFEGSEPRGPSSWRDGEAITLGAGNPESDWGELEEWEYVEPPLLTLSRSYIRDFCAHGRQRGAIGVALTQMVCDPGQFLTINACGFAGSKMNAVSVGVCGGYPHINSKTTFFHDTNAAELAAKSAALPSDHVEAKEMIAEGRLEVGSISDFGGHETPPVLVKHGDLICHAHHAGSAWGDPIERRSELVAHDVQKGWISDEVARDIYGVVLMRDADGHVRADDAGTTAAREAIRQQRKERARPAREVYEEERNRVLTRDYPLAALHEMYRDAAAYDGWHQRFYSFWQLPDDFEL